MRRLLRAALHGQRQPRQHLGHASASRRRRTALSGISTAPSVRNRWPARADARRRDRDEHRRAARRPCGAGRGWPEHDARQRGRRRLRPRRRSSRSTAAHRPRHRPAGAQHRSAAARAPARAGPSARAQRQAADSQANTWFTVAAPSPPPSRQRRGARAAVQRADDRVDRLDDQRALRRQRAGFPHEHRVACCAQPLRPAPRSAGGASRTGAPATSAASSATVVEQVALQRQRLGRDAGRAGQAASVAHRARTAEHDHVARCGTALRRSPMPQRRQNSRRRSIGEPAEAHDQVGAACAPRPAWW